MAAGVLGRVGFTARERAVLEHVLQEASNEHIARSLGCSVKTVEFHIANMLRKVGVRSRVGLVLCAVADETAHLGASALRMRPRKATVEVAASTAGSRMRAGRRALR